MSNLNISTILFYSYFIQGGSHLEKILERQTVSYEERDQDKTSDVSFRRSYLSRGNRVCWCNLSANVQKICTWMFVICVSFTKAPTRHLGNSLRRTDLAENRQQLLPSASHSCERAAVWPTENNGSSPDVREPPALVKESSETLGRLCSLLSMQSDKPNGNLYKEISKGSAPQNS